QPGQRLLGPLAQLGMDRPTDCRADLRCRLLIDAHQVAVDALEAGQRRLLGTGLGLAVKGSQAASQFHDALRGAVFAVQEVAERSGFGQTFHLDRPFDSLALALDPHSVTQGNHWHHAQVDAGSEAAIEPYFLLAEVTTINESAEIEEIEPDWFLHLVGEG